MRRVPVRWLATRALPVLATLAAAALPVAAGVVKAVTHHVSLRFSYGGGALDDAGGQVFYASTENPNGDTPLIDPQVYRFDVQAEARERLTNFEGGVVGGPAVSDDGQWVVFESFSDPLGTNADGSAELFVMRSDGTGLLQLTDHPASETGGILEFTFAGGASRVAFIATSDLLGSNASHIAQVFVVNRDATGLSQLTHHTMDGAREINISDDGMRIAYEHQGDPFGTNSDGGRDVFVILADGTGHRQLTFGSDGDSFRPSLSGDGTRVAFVSWAGLLNPNPLGAIRLHVVDWDGSNLRQLTHPSVLDFWVVDHPSITDDGSVIFYDSDEVTNDNLDRSYEVWRILADGTGNVQLTATEDGSSDPVAAGGGGRIAFFTRGPFPGGLNSDGGSALIATDDAGANGKLVAETEVHGLINLDLTPSGARAVFLSDQYDPDLNPNRLWQVHRIEFDGSDPFQVTRLTDGDVMRLGGITDDGVDIVFSATGNPLGTSDGGQQIYAIRADGSDLRQLTPPCCGSADYPVVAGSGSWVVFQATDNFTGENPDLSAELFRVRLDGTGLSQVTDDDDSLIKIPRVDRAGTWVVYQSRGDPLGLNADGSDEIFRIRTDGSGLQQITNDPVHDSIFPDISASGDKVVYSSTADPLGNNPENNSEIFLYDAATGETRQLTQTTTGDSRHPRISDDGSMVYFKSTAPFFGEETGYVPYRLHLDTGALERAGGIANGGMGGGSFRSDEAVAPGENGIRAAFLSWGDADGSNPDYSIELFAVDFEAPATIQVSKTTPTVVSWTAEPKYALYDVIRGDLASLALSGDTVDLGPVVCLEDGSRDNSTSGNEDPEEPPPGQGFFFLYRGSQGPSDPPDPWGFGTGGKERIPATGACP